MFSRSKNTFTFNDDKPVQNTIAARLFMPATLKVITVFDKNN